MPRNLIASIEERAQVGGAGEDCSGMGSEQLEKPVVLRHQRLQPAHRRRSRTVFALIAGDEAGIPTSRCSFHFRAQAEPGTHHRGGSTTDYPVAAGLNYSRHDRVSRRTAIPVIRRAEMNTTLTLIDLA